MTSFIIFKPALMDSKEPRCTWMLGVGVVVNKLTATERGMGSHTGFRPPTELLSLRCAGHAKAFPNCMICAWLKQGSCISCVLHSPCHHVLASATSFMFSARYGENVHDGSYRLPRQSSDRKQRVFRAAGPARARDCGRPQWPQCWRLFHSRTGHSTLHGPAEQ